MFRRPIWTGTELTDCYQLLTKKAKIAVIPGNFSFQFECEMNSNFFIIFLFFFLHFFESDLKVNKIPVALHLVTEIKEREDFFIGGLICATMTGNEEILILDYNQKKVFVFDISGNLVDSFGRQGRGPGEFQTPAAIKTDHEGYIYIPDTGNVRISIWNPDFTYRSDYELIPGWRAKLNKNSSQLFLSVKPFRKLPNGNDAFMIFKLGSGQNGLQPFYTYEFDAFNNWFDEDRLFDSTSYWDITNDGKIVASGKFDLSPIRIINSENGKVEAVFSESLEPVMFTTQEMEARLISYPLGSEIREIQSQRRNKQIYSNIQISTHDYIWVHRNKEFGARDELDIYSLKGEFKTMVTIPASENELKMLGIYGEKILFHLTTPEGEERLHVYRIEYSEE